MRAIIILISLYCCFVTETQACLSYQRAHDQIHFLVRWKDSSSTLYNGNSVDELLALCPNGCGPPNCNDFKVFGPSGSVSRARCTSDDIIKLRKAQKLAQGWKNAIKTASHEVAVKSILLIVIIVLILLLIIRGHYRVRYLSFLPSDRQWELEKDPTWGLPGKVWGLVQSTIVKSEDADSKPTDRKDFAYTENPTTLGDTFWYYKQALRDMYKKHKYYKRNRYFHKLAFQFLKLGTLIPETLRSHKAPRRRAGETEEQQSNESSAEAPENLPCEIDLADEVTMKYLTNAKNRLQYEVKKETLAGNMVLGRYHHPHHHHHHHPTSTTPLTKDEVEVTAKLMEVNPNEDFVNVDGEMMRHPLVPSQEEKGHRHRHHNRPQKHRPNAAKLHKQLAGQTD